MKFTLSWLHDHLDSTAPLDDILYALTDLGLEVEGVSDPAAKLGAFRICRVIEAVPHPNADRLRLCRVATYPGGPGTAMEEVQVVCGAPNARTGLVGVFAPVGTYVPGTGVDLKPGVIRGVESNGMLCSEREMELSDDHDGIIDLPEDAPLGARFIDYRGLNDPMIHIKITPNRPDALGVRGVARDLAARGLGTLKPRPIPAIKGAFASPVTVQIDPALKNKGCPHFAGRTIRGVRNGPSPAWMQARLKAIGLRPISALVDITNYFTFGLNRPLHVFDVAKVHGPLRVHAALGGETLLALDGKTYTLSAGQMVISDDQGPESLAGIMGGEVSGCTDATTDVFLESAWWD
ncbi:MAG: phenylalanine--tRNA ligase subunit beta, partial [Paracoccaceae bacterium]